ncbi:MAG: chromosome segregation SMC family protein, partial [Peptoniphilaceae bacterium]
MHLIEMELYGFKSFAKRTRIRFSEDITAIVGPNGSGKSNIVDGIMWALGESSVKQLRGNKMEDVIFSGTDRQQGVNFAEVVLTFDNKDGFFDLPYEELSVSRKYFRSGESQYTINKKRVRQKDVREIFLDTGIGKNGYSFIGQGQIEEILSTRPQDRRNAFEEAAGISKFKLRKEETLRNLNKTTEHIERIDDIFSELKNRSGEMEEKRTKALRLNELESEKEKYSYALLTREVASAKEKQEKIRARYKESEAAWQEEKEANRLLEAAIQEKELKIESDGDSEGALSDEILTLIRKKEQTSGDLRSKIERSNYLKEAKTEREAAAETLRAELEGLIAASEKQEKEVQALKGRMDEKASALDGMKADYERVVEKVAAVDSGEKSRREALDQLADRRHSLESRLQALDYLLKERAERLAQLKDRRKEWARDTEELAKNLSDYGEKESKIKGASAGIEARLVETRDSLVEMKGQIDAMDGQIKNLTMGMEGIEREKRYLERLRDNHEGFQHGVKQFLKAARSESFYNAVIGPVAEHLHVEEADALAISTALGYGGQNIILKDDRRIGTILSYLKSRKMGRLTFLPLNNLTPRPL